MKLFLLAICIIAVAVAGIAIKMFFIKDFEFKKKCSGTDASGKKIPCSCGGNDGDDSQCENYEIHHGKEKKDE